MTETEFTIASMESGECRWVGRYDVHVYCRRPAGREATYCVVCPDAALEYGNWLPLKQAAALVDEIVAGALPAAA